MGPADTLFYDGHCALCHGTVRFVLARERGDSLTRFAPLQGELVKELVPEAERAGLPDSVVVLTADGQLLTRSAAVLHIVGKLGGFWRGLAAVGGVIPTPLRDAVYDGIAKIRYRVFGMKDDACPVIPASLRSRFDLR